MAITVGFVSSDYRGHRGMRPFFKREAVSFLNVRLKETVCLFANSQRWGRDGATPNEEPIADGGWHFVRLSLAGLGDAFVYSREAIRYHAK